MPVAPRPDDASWALTAATAANVMAVTNQATAKDSEPTTPRPEPISDPATARTRTRSATVTATIAAASGAHRPTTPAPTSSVRPASSSPRLCRTTRTTESRPTIAAPIAVILNIASWPSDVGSEIGPNIASSAGLTLTWVAAATRSASVG